MQVWHEESPTPCLSQDKHKQLIEFTSTRAWEGSHQDNIFTQPWKSDWNLSEKPSTSQDHTLQTALSPPTGVCAHATTFILEPLHLQNLDFLKHTEKNKAESCTREFSVSELLKRSEGVLFVVSNLKTYISFQHRMNIILPLLSFKINVNQALSEKSQKCQTLQLLWMDSLSCSVYSGED